MNLPRLWTTNQELVDPFRAMRRELENAVRSYDQNSSSPGIGAGAPAINVAETKDAFEVTGRTSWRGRERYQGQPRQQPVGHFRSEKGGKYERRKGLACRGAELRIILPIMSLPFEPEDGAVDAHFDKAFRILRSRSQLKPSRPRKQFRSRQERCRPRQALRRVSVLLELTVCVDAVEETAVSRCRNEHRGAFRGQVQGTRLAQQRLELVNE